jgi:hypothetical protein
MANDANMDLLVKLFNLANPGTGFELWAAANTNNSPAVYNQVHIDHLPNIVKLVQNNWSHLAASYGNVGGY